MLNRLEGHTVCSDCHFWYPAEEALQYGRSHDSSSKQALQVLCAHHPALF